MSDSEGRIVGSVWCARCDSPHAKVAEIRRRADGRLLVKGAGYEDATAAEAEEAEREWFTLLKRVEKNGRYRPFARAAELGEAAAVVRCPQHGEATVTREAVTMALRDPRGRGRRVAVTVHQR